VKKLFQVSSFFIPVCNDLIYTELLKHVWMWPFVAEAAADTEDNDGV